MKKKVPLGSGDPNYETTPIAGLKKSRKGKHYDLMGRIMGDLRQLRSGLAIRIPLSSTKGVPVLKRSVIVRTAAKEKMRVATSSDDENYYVWKV